MSTPEARRWLLAVTGLPLIVAVLLFGHAVARDDWATGSLSLVTTPFTFLALLAFVEYASRPGPSDDGVGRSLYWLLTGICITVSLISTELFGIRWLEGLLDGIGVVLGAASIGDGFRGLAGRIPHSR
jgi:hypothetical protein